MNSKKAANKATSHRFLSRPWRLFAATLIAGTLLAIGGSAVAAPYTDPGPLHPISRWINLCANQSANSAHVKALEMDGYELTPAIKLNLDAD